MTASTREVRRSCKTASICSLTSVARCGRKSVACTFTWSQRLASKFCGKGYSAVCDWQMVQCPKSLLYACHESLEQDTALSTMHFPSGPSLIWKVLSAGSTSLSASSGSRGRTSTMARFSSGSWPSSQRLKTYTRGADGMHSSFACRTLPKVHWRQGGWKSFHNQVVAFLVLFGCR